MRASVEMQDNGVRLKIASTRRGFLARGVTITKQVTL
jgi:hypothetical protein